MTQAEFAQGWALLVLQPWGWRYNQVKDGHPSPEAMKQLNFYYHHLSWAHPDAWMKVAQTYAGGKEWPSIQELRGSLQAINSNYIKSLTDDRRKRGEPMPDEVREIFNNLGKKCR